MGRRDSHHKFDPYDRRGAELENLLTIPPRIRTTGPRRSRLGLAVVVVAGLFDDQRFGLTTHHHMVAEFIEHGGRMGRGLDAIRQALAPGQVEFLAHAVAPIGHRNLTPRREPPRPWGGEGVFNNV